MADVTVKMQGMEKLMKKLRGMAIKGNVKAGVLEGAANADGKSVLEYAPIQEFGGQIAVTKKMRGFLAANYGIHLKKSTTHINIPARSFLRTTFVKHRKEWLEYLAKAIKAGMAPETSLEYVGMRMQDDIIQQIKSNMPPPNSPATDMIKRKYAPAVVGQTLQYTGTLVHSIDYEVSR